MLTAALAIGAQVGVQVAFDPVMPKFDRLSPATGFKKIFSKRSMIDLLKMTIKALVVGVALWKTMVSMFPLITTAMYEPLALLSSILWSALLKVLFVTAVLFLAIGAVDWKIQHWLMLRSQRMSKDEVKREMKEREGEPKLKRERRKRAKEMVNGGGDRQAAVARSNVVVVNPTHYAVALRYAPDESPLPVVLAKGVDADALEIRRLAAQFDVPIVANPPVARALHKVDEHASIPPELFQVVAAILRWVQSMRPPPVPESVRVASADDTAGGEAPLHDPR
jgi:type III secretion protein U